MPLDWIYGLVGGVLIGCAGAVLLLALSRIVFIVLQLRD